MDHTIIPPTRPYVVTAAFQSGGETFATERFIIEVIDSLEPYAIAQARAYDSVYANDRIPELEIALNLAPIDPNDPEPQPPSAAIKPICSGCDSNDITSDACARWDVERQDLDLAGSQDRKTCGNCGVDSDDLIRWVPARPFSDTDAFFWAVIAVLDRSSLAHSIEFQLFCVISYDTLTIERAADAWRARKPAA